MTNARRSRGLIRGILVGFSLLPSLFFFSICHQRAKLPYNEESRYFDEVEGVVYHAQSVPVYLLAGFACLIFPVIIGALTRKVVGRAANKASL